MRDTFRFSDLPVALAAWDTHQSGYLASLKDARQPAPTPEALAGYRAVWLEGYLSAKASTEPQPATEIND